MTCVAKIWSDISWVPHFQYPREWDVNFTKITSHRMNYNSGTDEDCTHHGDVVCLWLNAVPITAVGIEHMAPEMIACKFIKLIPLKFKTVKKQIEH